MTNETDVFPARFGSLVRSRRQVLGMTSQDAYRKGGMTNKTWKRLEEGLPVKTFTIVALDRVFDEQPGTMLQMWETRDADVLARHWGLLDRPVEPVTPPATVEPDIHLEVGTPQYNESLRFLLRHDSDSIRLLSAPVYEAMQYRAKREREIRVSNVEQEIGEATKALNASTSDYTKDYLSKRVQELQDRLAELHGEEAQTTSLIGMLGDRRRNG